MRLSVGCSYESAITCLLTDYKSVNREQFLEDSDVSEFVEWLGAFCHNVLVKLEMRSSKRIPGGFSGTIRGLDNVIDAYTWHATWTDSDDKPVVSSGWDSTAISLGRLASNLNAALSTASERETLRACSDILVWGGERNRKVGARPFLEAKAANNQLVTYLNVTRDAFSLEKGDLTKLDAVEELNAMLTKIHALASGDGLPIYDSRVAAASAALVEIFRVDTQRKWTQVPKNLLFPTMAAEPRRRVQSLHSSALVSDGALMGYASPGTPSRWASAKIRLGWIVQAVLEKDAALLSHQVHSRQHAFEATLFILGYDVRCLAPNL
jgi:hypothetical protein